MAEQFGSSRGHRQTADEYRSHLRLPSAARMPCPAEPLSRRQSFRGFVAIHTPRWQVEAGRAAAGESIKTHGYANIPPSHLQGTRRISLTLSRPKSHSEIPKVTAPCGA